MSMFDQELADTLEDVYRKRGTHQCAAFANHAVKVPGIKFPSRLGRRCLRQGHHQESDQWFCWQHAPMWRTHYEILDRILEIPRRP